jgi:pimeloyl-[acyl-carrier protein] methyl ester esterase
MPIIKAKDGSDISYSDQGSGQPVLFLHGWMMSKRVWHFQLPLSSALRIITIDLRGHGDSDANSFSYDACLSDIEDLLKHLGIRNIVIVGWSMGSQIALRSYFMLKERISGLLLAGGTPRFCNEDDYGCGLEADEARGMAIRIKRDYRGTSGQFFKSMFAADEISSGKLIDIAAKTVGSLPPLQISLSALKELSETDLRNLLPETNLPVLLIHGAKDSICPSCASEFMANHLPIATMKIFPASGHAPFLTAPEMFNAELTGFIRRVNGGD